MDLQIPGALPTMLCRPPTINGSARAVRNLTQVKAMPGITDVAIILHTDIVAGGVAVRGATFGQCIDAVDALDVDWGPGSVDGKSEADVLSDLKRAELPMTPALPLSRTLAKTFTFHFRPGDPLETNCAVAHVRSDQAEIYLVVPEVANLGTRAARFQRVRVTYTPDTVLAFDQRHTSVATDFSMGFGDLLSARLATLPAANSLGYAEGIFSLTQNVPYNFGAVTQLLNEVDA